MKMLIVFITDDISCGAVDPPEGYHNEIDDTKKYPDCCQNLVKND